MSLCYGGACMSEQASVRPVHAVRSRHYFVERCARCKYAKQCPGSVRLRCVSGQNMCGSYVR